MSEKRIGIFRASDLAADGLEDVLFFSEDLPSMLKTIHQQAAELSDAEHKGFATPIEGIRGVRIGEIAVLPVDGDDSIYEIKSGDGTLSKPAGTGKPPGEPGSWAIQTLIFSKEYFTLEQAQQWISTQDNFADRGVDETETSYRFRQYDPEYFSRFRTIDIKDGIKAVYGLIVGEPREDVDVAQSEVDKAIEEHEEICVLNTEIIKRGVKLLLCSETISKAEDETEERYILGLVLEPNDGDDAPLKPDTQGDVYSAKAIRDTAHNWMERYGQIDLMHSWEALGAGSVAVLESYLAPVDFKIGEGDSQYLVKKGTWLLALRILDDNLWKAIKDGEIGAFSVGGKATRTPLAEADSREG